MAEGSRLQVDERRAQLLELGVGLFSARPYEEVSIDDIAREAGISKGLLYHYFGGKKAFYAECLRLEAGRLVAAVEPCAAEPPPERARVGLRGYLDFVAERAPAYTTLMHGGIGSDPEVLAIVDETRDRIARLVWDGLGLEVPPPAFRVAVRAWVGAVEAASLDWLAHGDLERDEVVDLLVAALGAQLLAAGRADPSSGLVAGLEAVGDALAALFGRR